MGTGKRRSIYFCLDLRNLIFSRFFLIKQVTVKSFPVLAFNVVIITLVRIYTGQSFIALTSLLVSLKYLILGAVYRPRNILK